MRSYFSTLTLACLPLIPLISCSASNGGKTPDAKIKLIDSGKTIDAPAACQALASYTPTFGSNDLQQAQAGSDNTMEAAVAYIANLTEANPVDLLDIELWIGGTGTDFPTALANGTYTLSAKGDDNYNTCDACVLLWPQVAVGSDGSLTGLTAAYFSGNQYMAKSGTMTLTSVTTNITGTLSNVALRHVTFDGSNNEADATDNCDSMITSASFTAKIGSAGSAAFNGKTDDGRNIHFTLHHRYH